MVNKISPPKCCDKPMELKFITTTTFSMSSNIDHLYFQCKKCGMVKTKHDD